MPSREYADEEIRALAYKRWGISVKRASRYHYGPCPFCRAGRDRFVIWRPGNFWCRVCETKGWLEDNRKGWEPDADLQKDLAELLAQEENKRLAHLAWLREKWQRESPAEAFHTALLELHMEDYWRAEGIPEWAIGYYKLGYCADKSFRGEDGQEYHSPAYTIPIYDPATWQMVNMQYRLLEVQEGYGGKYRQESGIPASAFYTRRGLLEGKAIVVEGAKKAIVVLECIGKACQVIGWPSIMPSTKLIQQLDGFAGGLWIILDPGSNNEGATERAARVLHPVPVRWVEMPTKPDDAIVKFGMGKAELRNYLKQARRL